MVEFYLIIKFYSMNFLLEQQSSSVSVSAIPDTGKFHSFQKQS